MPWYRNPLSKTYRSASGPTTKAYSTAARSRLLCPTKKRRAYTRCWGGGGRRPCIAAYPCPWLTPCRRLYRALSALALVSVRGGSTASTRRHKVQLTPIFQTVISFVYCLTPDHTAGVTRTLRVIVGDNTGAAASSEVVVGNCGGKDAGDFAFDLPGDAKTLGFSVEPMAGSVAAGQKVSSSSSSSPPLRRSSASQVARHLCKLSSIRPLAAVTRLAAGWRAGDV